MLSSRPDGAERTRRGGSIAGRGYWTVHCWLSLLTGLAGHESRAQSVPVQLPTPIVPAYVMALAVQPDGKIIVGGVFSLVGNLPRTNIARLHPNGALDETWFPALSSSSASSWPNAIAANRTNIYVATYDAHLYRFSATGNSPAEPLLTNVSVKTLMLDGNDLYVGGGGWVGKMSVAAPQATFVPLAEVTGGLVLALAIADGELYVGGNFTGVGGIARSGLAKLTTTGVVDTNWNPAVLGSVNSLAVGGAYLYAAGYFTQINGVGLTHLARVTRTGSGMLDGWRPNPNRPVSAIVHRGTDLFVTGEFQNIGGLNKTNQAKIPTGGDGTADATWQADTGFPWPLRALAGTESGLVLGSYFGRVNGSPFLSLAQLDWATGAPVESFRNPVGSPGKVKRMAMQPDGKLIVSGDFSALGRVAAENLARLNRDGSVDENWKPSAKPFGATFGPYAIKTRGRDVFLAGYPNLAQASPLTNGVMKIGALDGAVDASWNLNIDGTIVHALSLVTSNIFAAGPALLLNPPAPIARLNAAGHGERDANWGFPCTLSFNQVPFPFCGSGCDTTLDPVTIAVTDNHLFLAGGTGIAAPGFTNGTPIAKFDIAAPGNLDWGWKPTNVFHAYGLAGAGENLFVAHTDFLGGHRVGRFNVHSNGLSDAAFAPPLPVNFLEFSKPALCVQGTNLFVAYSEYATNIPIGHLLRTGTEGTGQVTALWTASMEIYAVEPFGQGAYVGGNPWLAQSLFVSDPGLAYCVTAEPPTLVRRGTTNVLILRNPLNGWEVTHFRIQGIQGGSIFQSDGSTAVGIGEFITAAQGAAGLVFVGATNGTVTVAASLNGTMSGVGSTSTADFSQPQPAVFRLSTNEYEGSEGTNILRVNVQKVAGGAASVKIVTEEGTAYKYDYDTGLGDYEEKSVTLTFAANETNKSLPISLNNDAVFLGDRTFWVYLTNAAGAQLQLAYPAKAAVTILEDDPFGPPGSVTSNSLPATLPETYATGGLQVELLPPGVGQWRLAGEVAWRNSGAVVSNLAAGLHTVEFKALPDYYTLLPAGALVVTGQVRQVSFAYTARPGAVTGGALCVQLDPGVFGGWRLTAESIAQTNGYHLSGAVVTNLPGGSYQVEFGPAPAGYVAPQAFTVHVPQYVWQSNVYAATYLPVSEGSLLQPAVLSWSDVTNVSRPHLYNGQLATDAGLSSGVVVKERVVLTAAHALFNEATLDWTTEARWLFQKHAGDYVSAPQAPRGSYVSAGYAAQRSNDLASGGALGISTSQSQQLDAAALYFVENYFSANLPGRGGYAGFLASDAGLYNEHLLGNANKFLAGYPLIPGQESNWGKMYASTPTNLVFESLNTRVFRTAALRSFPGNSGGALYVQWTNGHYYPAAIYLGGSAQTRVRAIDGEVVDLINRAEASASAGGNHTGGGVITISSRFTGGEALAYVLVELGPPEAVAAGGAWRVVGRVEDWTAATNTPIWLTAGGEVRIEFRSATGWELPVEELVGVESANAVVTVRPRYRLRPVVGYQGGLRLRGSAGLTYRIEYTDNLSSPTWITLTNITLSTTNALLVPGTQPSNTGQRFFRAAKE